MWHREALTTSFQHPVLMQEGVELLDMRTLLRDELSKLKHWTLAKDHSEPKNAKIRSRNSCRRFFNLVCNGSQPGKLSVQCFDAGSSWAQ